MSTEPNFVPDWCKIQILGCPAKAIKSRELRSKIREIQETGGLDIEVCFREEIPFEYILRYPDMFRDIDHKECLRRLQREKSKMLAQYVIIRWLRPETFSEYYTRVYREIENKLKSKYEGSSE